MVKATSTLLEIEIDGLQNQCHYFRPIARRLRGRFDLHRAVKRDKDAAGLLTSWPEPIPGQRLQLNLETGEAAIIEPLYEPEFAVLREKIEQRAKLGPEREPLGVVDVPTWLYWLAGAVEGGSARIVSGTLPAKIEGKPRLRFHSTEQPNPLDRLAAAFERQAEAFERQSELLAKLVAER